MATKADVIDLTKSFYESLVGMPAQATHRGMGPGGDAFGEVTVKKVGFSSANGIELVDEDGNLFSIWVQKTRIHVDLEAEAKAAEAAGEPAPKKAGRPRKQKVTA